MQKYKSAVPGAVWLPIVSITLALGLLLPTTSHAIHPDGSGLRIIVKDTQWIANYNPAWSPDGSSIAFGRQSTTQKASTYTYTWDIFTAPSAGGKGANLKNLTGDTNNYVSLTGWR